MTDTNVTGPDMTGTDERIGRLLRWYPRSWRDRYGDEFAELLAADLDERPRCWQRTVNVAANGLRSRLATAGLAGHALDPQAAARAGLITAACSAAAFAVTSGSLWSQLAICLQWAVPGQRGITQAMDLMSAAVLLCAVLAALAAAPVARAVIAAVARGNGRPLAWPAALIAASTLVIVTGGWHFQSRWPGTGGHLLAHQGLVPGGVAAFGWSTTMWMTTYWAHPAALAALPAGQIAWMVVCPAALGGLITGSGLLLRRVEMSPRVLRYETWLAHAAGAAMAVFAVGALWWLLTAAGQSGATFRAGTMDDGMVSVLAVAVAAGLTAARRARIAAQTRPADAGR
jgi:hypothetical protein